MQDYEENSVNTIFYDNDRRQACVKSAFRLDLYITVTKNMIQIIGDITVSYIP